MLASILKFGPMRPDRAFLRDPPLLFAHRGGAKLWPENTLSAFQGALDLGVRYLEADLHATRDGVLVVNHDDHVNRTTNGAGAVRDHTLSELRRLDAGYWFSEDGRTYPYRGKGVTIPTLEEVTLLEPSACINLEIKQRSPDIVEALWRFIDERGLADRFLVAASHDALVRRFRRVCRGRVATSAGTWEAQLFWGAARTGLQRFLRPKFDALQVPETSGPLTVVDARLVRAAHQVGLQVHVWTIDELTVMQRLLALGVDGLMSDRPDLLVGGKLGGALSPTPNPWCSG